MIRIGSLFSGIGGFELGLERSIPNSTTVWQVEQNKFCRSILAKHWPAAVLYDDVCTVGADNLEPVDVLCGGFPCQDLSYAGKGEGLNGARSGLWWEMHRIISELRPRVVVLENVPALVTRGLGEVLGSLSAIGYDAEWTVISAADFGAPHLRKRIFIVAYPNQERSLQAFNRGASSVNSEKRNLLEGRSSQIASNSNQSREVNEGSCTKGEYVDQAKWKEGAGKSNGSSDTWPSSNANQNGNGSKESVCAGWKESSLSHDPSEHYWRGFPTQRPVCSRNDGVSNRLAKLAALGNAIVPQCSEWIGQKIWDSGLLY